MVSRPSKFALKRKVYSRIKRAHDLETHISRVTIADEQLIDIRDYVPSSKQYGRGASFSIVHLDALWLGLEALTKDLKSDD